MPAPRLSIASLVLLAACGGAPSVTVYVGADARAAVEAYGAAIDGDRLHVSAVADPLASLGGDASSVALVADLDCGECYRLDAVGTAYAVHAGSVLGLQYGLTDLLEQLGFRFFHPRRASLPSALATPSPERLGKTITPQMKLRGLQLHTLHPIEPYFDFWEPSAAHLDGAKRVVDWLVKSRGNYLQWPALDDIVTDGARLTAWQAHTRAIVEYAHMRGVAVGLGVQLFDKGSLQHAINLLHSTDDLSVDTTPLIAGRLQAVLGDLGFDRINLTFGEFFSADPDVFIAQIDHVYDAVASAYPGVELAANIHVGNAPSQHITYMGQDLLYYFLVQFANPAIVPWIHSVMYYDLFEDAGGAYLHDDFSTHRDFLLGRLQRHQRVAYQPESAYWVAFDNSVPTYLPIYMYTRWLDQDRIAAAAAASGGDALQEHVLFSTGWEWGYWQNDYYTLRTNFERPARWQQPIDDMFAPYGADGAALAAQIETLAQAQHDALIGQRLAAYVAAQDFLNEAGYQVGIVSQPKRTSFAEVAAMSPDERTTFVAAVVEPLDQLAAVSDSVAQAVAGLRIGTDDAFFSEMVDGTQVDADRVRYIAALYRAVAASADGQPTDQALAAAKTALEDARQVVAHRHGHLFDPEPKRLTTSIANLTSYQYGYLYEADTLCYWVRERAQVDNLISGAGVEVPSCVLFD